MARNQRRNRRNRKQRVATSKPLISAAVKFRRKHGPQALTAGWEALEDWEKAECTLTGEIRAHKARGVSNRDRVSTRDKAGKAKSVCNRWRSHDARGRICGRVLKMENEALVRLPGDKRNATKVYDILTK